MFYLFCREFFGRRAAVIGTLVLTFSFWHIHYSRTAFPLISLPLLECGALYFFGRGARTGKAWALLLAGVLMGLGIYTYESFAFFAVALAVVLLFFLWRSRVSLQLLGQRVGGVTLFGAVAVLAALPFLLFVARSPKVVFGSHAIVSLTNTPEYKAAQGCWGKVDFYLNRAGRASSVLFKGRQLDASDGLGTRALLDPIAGALLALGVVVALRRIPDWRYLLLFIGLVAGIVPLALLTPVWGENRRLINALPMVFAGIGVGADVGLRSVHRWFVPGPEHPLAPERRRYQHPLVYPAVVMLVGLLLLVSAVVNVRYYFSTWPKLDSTRWVFVYDLVGASEYLNSLKSDRPYVYFYSARWSYNYETRRFLARDIPGEDRSREFGRFSLERGPQRPNVVYLFMPPYLEQVGQVRQMYPGGTYTERRDEKGRVLFAAYYLRGPP